ncbi:hypothetical protein V8E54_003099 [Elaphomyces granulatus]
MAKTRSGLKRWSDLWDQGTAWIQWIYWSFVNQGSHGEVVRCEQPIALSRPRQRLFCRIVEPSDSQPSFGGGLNSIRDPLDPLDGEDEDIDDDLEDADEQPDPGAGMDKQILAHALDQIYDWHASDHIFREYGEALDFDATLKEVRTPCGSVVRGPGLATALSASSVRPDNRSLRGGFERPATSTDAGSLVRVAPTGIAAHNISGRPLHSLLRLLVKSKYLSTLHNRILAHLHDHWRDWAYMIIHEKSIKGAALD